MKPTVAKMGALRLTRPFCQNTERPGNQKRRCWPKKRRNIPETKGECHDYQQSPRPVQAQFSHRLDGDEQNQIVRDHVEGAAHVQNQLQVQTRARDRVVPDLLTGRALPYLGDAGAGVEARHDDDETYADLVEAGPARGREDATVQAQHRQLGDADHDAVLDRGDVEPVRRLVGLLLGDVPAVLAAVVRHGRPHDAAVGHRAGPADGDEDILGDPGALDEDAGVHPQQEEDGDDGHADGYGEVGQPRERRRVIWIRSDAWRRRQTRGECRRRRR